MDPIGNLQPIILPTQAPAVSTASQAPVLPAPVPAQQPQPAQQAQTVDVQAAEQRRYEMVRSMAQDIANIFIVSDKTFSLFKDASGQYVTRFTSLRDGKVTYIPEPELFKKSSFSGEVPSSLHLKV